MRCAFTAVVLGVAAVLCPQHGAAGAGDAPDQDLAALFAEGKKWFEESGDTDLPPAERNAARVKAWKSLWPAREILDRRGEEDPAAAERLEREFGEVRMMVHWLKKESPLGLLESSGVGPKRDEEASSGWKNDWGPRPEEPGPAAPSPPSPGPGPPPAVFNPHSPPHHLLDTSRLDGRIRSRRGGRPVPRRIGFPVDGLSRGGGCCFLTGSCTIS